MPDRRKNIPRVEDHGRLRRPGPAPDPAETKPEDPEPAPDPAGAKPEDPEPSPADTGSRTGRLQVKDGRHNVWETGVDDTQQLLRVLHDPDLELADEPPAGDGKPGNPYHSTGSWALCRPAPRRNK